MRKIYYQRNSIEFYIKAIEISFLFVMTLFSFHFLESSQCYIGGNSPNDVLTDEDDSDPHLHISNDDETQRSPHRFSSSDYNNNQTTNSNNCSSPPLQSKSINSIDNVLTATTTTTTTTPRIKVEQDNDFNCPSPLSPSIQTLPNKIFVTTNTPSSSSVTATGKRLTGTLNRLLHSAINRPNGHHYHHYINGVSSSPSTSASSSSTTAIIDSTSKEPKTSLEMTTQAIESMFIATRILFEPKQISFLLSF